MSEARATSTPPGTVDSPLSGLVSTTTNGRIVANNHYRRYAGRVTAEFRLNGQPDAAHKRVMYEIGRVYQNRARMCSNRAPDEMRVAQPLRTSEVLMTDLIGICKRFTATPPNFSVVDLSYVGEKLGRALAAYVQTGGLNCADIRGAAVMAIRTIATRDGPINPSLGHVMVARAVDVNVAGTFAVLTACVNGAGSTVYTDDIAVDMNNQVVLQEPVDAACALAVVNAMHILLSMYEACGQGSTIAYAIIRGLHSVASVVGHSDEGGWTRDVLRAGGFIRPYGGISVINGGFHYALPMPTLTSESTFCALCDSILLGSAGLAARADPCVEFEGRVYPTVIYATSEVRVEPGGDVAGNVQHGVDNHAQIALQGGAWSGNFISLLGSLFKTSGGAKAVEHLTRSITSCGPTPHIQHATIAPYFWIEPTTLYKEGRTSYADAHGHALLVGTLGTYAMPFFEQYTVTGDFGGTYGVGVRMRTMRTCGLVMALLDHPQNGLGNVVPKSFLEDRAMCKGGANTFEAARAAGNTLDTYHWPRQQNELAHPACFMYLGYSIGMKVQKTVYDDNNEAWVINHTPTTAELAGSIVITAVAPQRINNNALGWAGLPRGVRRARCLAAEALTNARATNIFGVQTGGEVMATGAFEPTTIFPAEGPATGPIGEANRSQGAAIARDDVAALGAQLPRVVMDGRNHLPLPRPAGGIRAEPGSGPPPPPRVDGEPGAGGGAGSGEGEGGAGSGAGAARAAGAAAPGAADP